MSQSMHPAVADYVIRHGIAVPQPFRGRVTVLVDDLYRVHLQTTTTGAVALLSRLATLPTAGSARDQWLQQVGKLAVGTLSAYPAACVVDPRETALWLQQVLVHPGDTSLDEAMGQFVNALSFWVRALSHPL